MSVRTEQVRPRAAAPDTARPSRPRAETEPTPYALYIRLSALEDAWRSTPAWPAGSSVAAAVVALDLLTALLSDCAADDRPYIDHRERADRHEELLADCRRLGREMTELLPAPEEDPAAADAVRLLTARSTGVPPARNSGAPPTAPVALLGERAHLRELRTVRPAGPEDHLFRGAHQITECWLHVAHRGIEAGAAAAAAGRWGEADRLLSLGARAVRLATGASRLLDLMDLADYHPLRVMLRDGSGAQSHSARTLPAAVRGAFDVLLTTVERDGRTLVHVLAHGESGAAAELPYLRSVRRLAKNCQEFLFLHYLLALGVLGSDNTGALGYGMEAMARRAAQPVLPELDGALHDFAKFADLRYARLSGALVLAERRRAGLATGRCPRTSDVPPDQECPSAVMVRAVGEYFVRLADRDGEGWAELFHPERGRMVDLAGTKPYVGRAHLRVFAETKFRLFSRMLPVVEDIEVTGPGTARARWTMDTTSYRGTEATARGVEEFRFAADGRILRATTEWNASEVSAVLWPGVPARPPGTGWDVPEDARTAAGHGA
ncbi:nuclear transport factor 2 family protein [Streptomyces sp. NPDC035033]|uniref:nuclear transport factor 2 family protein n=1 Tax=Streptomyces sp. NPDC035033 TaxID=3155368 RepID=UPI0033E71B6B